MAFLGSTPESTWSRNRRFLLGEEEEPRTGGPTPLEPEYGLSGDTRTPEFDLSSDVRTPNQVRRRSPTFRTPDPFSREAPRIGSGGAQSSPASLTAPPTTSPSSTAEQPQTAPREPQEVPSVPSYRRQGSLTERLFSPLETGAQRGQESLSSAAELFRHEAGPSRTYESTGAEGTLREAYQTGAQPAMESARGFLGARYEGPQGLDQQTVAELQKLTDDLRTRQRALGTGGGLETLIGQSVGGLTPGEARFEARRRLPEAEVQARDLGFTQVSPLAARLAQELQAAQEFAQQRAAEEADIADRSRGFLTGERGTISDAVQTLMEQRAQQQAAAEQAYADILAADPEGRLAAIREASPYLRAPTLPEGEVDVSGDIRLPPGTVDVSDDIRLPTEGADLAERFYTPSMREKEAADALFAEILARPEYANIAEYDPLKLTTTQRGKAFYGLPDEEGNVVDLRQVVDDPALRRLLYERQNELEAAFDPARGQARPFSRTPRDESLYSQVRPLYYGEDFQAADPVNYLGFDPGVRPSRENTATAVQREQYNRLNDLLGELDRIAEAGEEFRAAQIFADAESYLADEEAALEANKENLSEANEEWRQQVNSLRKKYRKKKREAEYAKIGSVVGTVVGTYTPLSVTGGALWGGPAGAAIGKSLA